MTLPYTLLINPLAVDAPDDGSWFAETFTEIDASEPALRVSELSTQRGDGVFETLSVVNGHAQEVQPHLARLARSAEICDLPAPNLGQWSAAISAAVAKIPQKGEFVIKLVLSRGVENGPSPTAWLHASEATDFSAVRESGVRVVLLDRGYDRGVAERAPWLLLGAKTLSYAVNMAALREAHRRGADDTIFITTDGYMMEGPTSSVIVRHGDTFSTPAPSGAILHGTTQMSLFQYLERHGHAVSYRDVSVEELRHADAVWLVSSVRLAVAVTEIDGRQVPADVPLTRLFTEYLLSARD